MKDVNNARLKSLTRTSIIFAYLIWEQTHKDSLYGKRHSNGSKRSFSRKKPYNQKRLRQTVFMLPENSNKEAV